MTTVPAFTPELWEKWVKDKIYAEERMAGLEDELDAALDEQEKASQEADQLRAERDAEKRLRVQAESDARRAKAAADQAAAAAAEASRSLKIGEKQFSGMGKDGESQELRVEIQQLKAKNHGLNTQIDALAVDHERLADLLVTAEKDKTSMRQEAEEVRKVVSTLEREKQEAIAQKEAKEAEWKALVASTENIREEAARLEAQNIKLGDELDRLAPEASSAKGKKAAAAAALNTELATATKTLKETEQRAGVAEGKLLTLQAEIQTAREEMEAMRDEAELKAGAAREGIAAADAQTLKATEEAESMRVELTALRERQAAEQEREKEVSSLRQEVATLEQRLAAGKQQAEEREGESQALEEKVAHLERQLETENEIVNKGKSEDAIRLVAARQELEEVKDKAAASEARAEELATELSESQRALEESKSGASVSPGNDENDADEEGTTAQLFEVMKMLKDAETAKRMAQDELVARNEKIEELEAKVLALSSVPNGAGSSSSRSAGRSGYTDAEGGAARSLAQDDDDGANDGGAAAVAAAVANGGEDLAAKVATMQAELDDLHALLENVSAERDAALGGAAAAANGEDLPAKIETMQAELDDMRAMLNNAHAERDAALNDLRRSGGDGALTSGEAGSVEEIDRLRRDCDKLRDKLSEFEDGDVPLPGAKRIRSLEAQVERLSEENMRQNDIARSLALQVEREKEELSQELISAKLQVAQLYMEVDGLKLQHRQDAIAATAAQSVQVDSANRSPATSESTPPSPTSANASPRSPRSPRSPKSPRSMVEL